jgi:hypothetical protein
MLDVELPADLAGELSPRASAEVHPRNVRDKDLQRAGGSGHIVLSGSEKGKRIMHVFQGLLFASCSQCARAKRPFIFTNLRSGEGAGKIASFIIEKGGLAKPAG